MQEKISTNQHINRLIAYLIFCLLKPGHYQPKHIPEPRVQSNVRTQRRYIEAGKLERTNQRYDTTTLSKQANRKAQIIKMNFARGLVDEVERKNIVLAASNPV